MSYCSWYASGGRPTCSRNCVHMGRVRLCAPSSADLQRLHGAELAARALEVRSAYLLHQALEARRPRIHTTYQAVRTWWSKYRSAPDGFAQRIDNVEMLESQYGDSLRECIQEQK